MMTERANKRFHFAFHKSGLEFSVLARSGPLRPRTALGKLQGPPTPECFAKTDMPMRVVAVVYGCQCGLGAIVHPCVTA